MKRVKWSLLVVALLLATAGIGWGQTDFIRSSYHDLVGLIGPSGNQAEVTTDGELKTTVIGLSDGDGDSLAINSDGSINTSGGSGSSDGYLPDDPADTHASMNGFNLTDLAEPTSDSDAATKNYVDQNASGSSGENFSVSTTHTSWADGLTDEEIHRVNLQSGEQLTVQRIEFRGKGGASDTASIDVYDTSTATVIGSADRGQTTLSPGSSGSGNTVLIRISNNTGASVVGSIRVQGVIE